MSNVHFQGCNFSQGGMQRRYQQVYKVDPKCSSIIEISNFRMWGLKTLIKLLISQKHTSNIQSVNNLPTVVCQLFIISTS